VSNVFDTIIKKYSQDMSDGTTTTDPTAIQKGQTIYDGSGQGFIVVEDDPTTTYKTLMPVDQQGKDVPEGITTVEDYDLNSQYSVQSPQGQGVQGPQTASIEPEFNLTANWEDQIPGGKADEKTPEDFPTKALDKGQDVEQEHTEDPQMALEIAMDHLMEAYDYYDKLDDMEKELKKEDTEIEEYSDYKVYPTD